MNARPPPESTPVTRGALRHAVSLCLALAVAAGCGQACAESTNAYASGTRPIATAHLDFKIVIPKVLQLNASSGTVSTNAQRTETVVIATSDTEPRRTVATRSDPSSLRAAVDALTRDVGHKPRGYTVAMP